MKEKDNKKKILLIVVALIILIVLIAGVTYAVFTYSKEGEKVNSISTGTVTMTYNEGENGVSITDALPMEDCTGEKLLGEEEVFNFTTSINMKGNFEISYEVTASKDASSTLEDNGIRIYLEKSEDKGAYSKVFGPYGYTPIGETDEFGAGANEMILDVGTVNKTTEYSYKLRMWVSNDYKTNDVSKSYTVKINVYGKDGAVDLSKYNRSNLLNSNVNCTNNN